MSRVRTTAAIVALAVLGPAAPPRTLAIVNTTVIPMDAERRLVGHTVLVRGGRIVAVGPAASVAVPAGAERVDGRGRFVVPGLADMHVHLYDTGGFVSYLAHGVTTVADLSGSPATLDWRRRVAAGELVGPTVLTAGPAIDGNPPLNATFEAAATPEDGRAIVRDQLRAGYDLVKVYSRLGPAAYAAVVDEAARQGALVAGHVPLSVGIRGVLAARQDDIAHAEEFFQAGDVPDSLFAPLAGATRAAGTYLTPNLFAYSDYLRSIDDLPGVLADPEMRYASAAALSEKLPANNRSIRPDPERFAAFLRARRAQFRRLTRVMADSGVPLLLGTDTEIFGFAGESAVAELEELVGAGLRPYEALAAATASAGRFVARSRLPAHRGGGALPFGVVAPGYRADLLLLDADPLLDVRNVRRLRGVVARGAWLPAARLAALRDSAARAHAAGQGAVRRFDSLVARGAVAEAAREVRARQRAERGAGGEPPLAHAALRGYAFRLSRTSPRDARVLRALAVALFPRSATALVDLARSDAQLGDTAAALASLRAASALRPHDAVVRDLLLQYAPHP